jgi:EpsI family protein
MTRRLITLQCFFAVGLGCVFILPKKIEMQPAALVEFLPDFVGEWYGEDEPVSQGEKDILGPDTQFVRKLYTNTQGDQIFVSLVFSGPDMATSIHRPERCLPAQGWTVVNTNVAAIPLANGELKATRLRNLRVFHQESAPPVNVYSLSYYWFVGHDAQTPSHLKRTWIDIRDRVLKGENQQWAYVMIASAVTKGLQPLGRSEAEVDEMIRSFIRDLYPQLQTRGATASSTS